MVINRLSESVPLPEGDVWTLVSSESEKLFIHNDGGEANIRTGIEVDLDPGVIGLVVSCPDSYVTVVPSIVYKSGEIVVRVRNEQSTGKYLESGSKIASMVLLTLSKVEKDRGKRATKTKA